MTGVRASALYLGRIRHRRHAPRAHAFSYPLFLLYLDLAELDRVFAGRWLWSTRRRAVARFDRRDHLGDPAVPLDTAVRDLVAARTGRRPRGPICLLTHLRYFGHGFNPVSLYYCFDADDAGRLDALVAEVNNTPWGEQHCYVLTPTPGAGGGGLTCRTPKAFHVSPFMGMDMEYRWRTTLPGDRLTVHVENSRAGETLFDATLTLERRPLTGPRLAWALARFPLMTARVVGWIYWEAFRLWLKKTPFHPHPRPRRTSTAP